MDVGALILEPSQKEVESAKSISVDRLSRRLYITDGKRDFDKEARYHIKRFPFTDFNREKLPHDAFTEAEIEVGTSESGQPKQLWIMKSIGYNGYEYNKEGNYAKAYKYSSNAAASGYAFSYFILSNIIQFGLGGFKADTELALSCLYEASLKEPKFKCNQDHGFDGNWYDSVSTHMGVAQAQHKLAYGYHKGINCDIDIPKAVYYYKKAADNNDAEACFTYGYCLYYAGTNKSFFTKENELFFQDTKLALKYLKFSSDQGIKIATTLYQKILMIEDPTHIDGYNKPLKSKLMYSSKPEKGLSKKKAKTSVGDSIRTREYEEENSLDFNVLRLDKASKEGSIMATRLLSTAQSFKKFTVLFDGNLQSMKSKLDCIEPLASCYLSEWYVVKLTATQRSRAIKMVESVIKELPNEKNARIVWLGLKAMELITPVIDIIKFANQSLKLIGEDDLDLLYIRGWLHRYSGTFENAIKDFNRVISINPDYNDTMYYLLGDSSQFGHSLVYQTQIVNAYSNYIERAPIDGYKVACSNYCIAAVKMAVSKSEGKIYYQKGLAAEKHTLFPFQNIKPYVGKDGIKSYLGL